jgi:hypothetical protein
VVLTEGEAISVQLLVLTLFSFDCGNDSMVKCVVGAFVLCYTRSTQIFAAINASTRKNSNGIKK